MRRADLADMEAVLIFPLFKVHRLNSLFRVVTEAALRPLAEFRHLINENVHGDTDGAPTSTENLGSGEQRRQGQGGEPSAIGLGLGLG